MICESRKTEYLCYGLREMFEKGCDMEGLILITLLQRLLRKKVIFITGTDEHGEKIATAAAARGSSPNEHCDVISQAYKALWEDVYLHA